VPPLQLDALVADGSLQAKLGWYRSVEYLGTLQGHPVATFTSVDEPKPNPADEAYLLVVGRGLMETWNLSAQDAAAYLASCSGNAGYVDPDALFQELLGWS